MAINNFLGDLGCCAQLIKIVTDAENSIECDLQVASFAAADMAKIYRKRDGTGTSSCSSGINFCPWCAKAFPQDLATELDQFAAQILGPDYCSNPDYYKTLPAEFQTDEWWRKRGL